MLAAVFTGSEGLGWSVFCRHFPCGHLLFGRAFLSRLHRGGLCTWRTQELLNELVEMLMRNQIWGGGLRTCVSNKAPEMCVVIENISHETSILKSVEEL